MVVGVGAPLVHRLGRVRDGSSLQVGTVVRSYLQCMYAVSQFINRQELRQQQQRQQ